MMPLFSGDRGARIRVSRFVAVIALVALAASVPGEGRCQSLSQVVEDFFFDFVSDEALRTSPIFHANHFLPANVAATAAVQEAFNTLMASNLSSFPISSTVSGVTFDFSTGVPVASTSSLGPVFTERAQTLGRNRINVGVNWSYLSFDEFRGVPTDGLQFAFTHQNLGAEGLGDNDNEFDVLHMDMDMEVDAHIVAFSATYGVTDRLDVGVALPVIRIDLTADATAAFDSYTKAHNGVPNHHYVGDNGDTLLTRHQRVESSSSGIGDLALRGKYTVYRGSTLDAAIFGDVRVPTGDEADYLGSGDPNVRGHLILSWGYGGFNPHLNLGYEYRGADNDPNEFEVFAGFDQKLTEQLTFAFDFLGEYDAEDVSTHFPGPITIEGVGSSQNPLPSPLTKVVMPTNIPNRADDLANASFGIKWSPREETLVFVNAIVSLNDGGIRSSITPTVGFERTF